MPARPPHPRPADGLKARAERLVEESTLSVVRLLRRAIDAGGFSAEDAISLALSSLARPGGPGATLSAKARGELRDVVKKLALGVDPSQPRTVLAFARSSSQAAWSLVNPGRHPGQAIDGVVAADEREDHAAERGQRVRRHRLERGLAAEVQRELEALAAARLPVGLGGVEPAPREQIVDEGVGRRRRYTVLLDRHRRRGRVGRVGRVSRIGSGRRGRRLGRRRGR